MYDLPPLQFNQKDFGKRVVKFLTDERVHVVFLTFIIIVAVGLIFLIPSSDFQDKVHNLFEKKQNNNATQLFEENKPVQKYISKIDYEQAIIDTVKEASPSVVSIIISKNMPVYEQQLIDPFGGSSPFNFQIPQYVQKGTQKQQVGAGSGFIVSEDGLVLTNKHVVIDKEAEYTVLTNDGKKYQAKVLAIDPVQDLAIIKIQDNSKFSAIKIGDSNSIQIGQGAIAIGNALGEFRNTVSVGVISGLGRTVSASGAQGFSETLEDIIQTDAAINPGNSGGPLLNLYGEVVGVNTATAESAQSVGFAIPINVAKRAINQVIKNSKIVYPFLGVRYILVNEEVKQKYNLSVDYGALVLAGGSGEPAITPNSAAAKAGLKEKDVILEMSNEKITPENAMSKIILKYNPGDQVTLKVLRADQEMFIDVTLGER